MGRQKRKSTEPFCNVSEIKKSFIVSILLTALQNLGITDGLLWGKLIESAKDITPGSPDPGSMTTRPTAGNNTVLTDTFNMSHCLENQAHVNLAVNSTHLVLSPQENKMVANTSLSCAVRLVAAEGNAIYVRHSGRHLSTPNCSYKNKWILQRENDLSLQINDCVLEETAYITSQNTLDILIVAGEPPILSALTARTVGKVLESGLITATMGFIQSPAYDAGITYPPGMDSWVTISSPLSHVTLISFRYIYTSKYRLSICPNSPSKIFTYIVQLYKGGNSTRNIVWKVCKDSEVPSPEVFSSRVMYVRFMTGKPKDYFGAVFKLLYSFHQELQPPSRVDNNTLWNCSVPGWWDFQRHFLCNVDRECEVGQDEASCFYTGHCGHGRLTLDNRCYIYHIANGTALSWRGSNLECQSRGGYLVSLNTPEEWRAVVHVLKMRRSPADVFVGLYDTPSVLPLLYKHTHMWADKIVAYFIQIRRRNRRCAIFEGSDYDKVNQHTVCDRKKMYVDFLCELGAGHSPAMEEETGNNRLPKKGKANPIKDSPVPLPVPRNGSVLVPTVKCPAGHVTHAFQACDEQSECWFNGRHGDADAESGAWGVPSRASCPAPMTSLPAMFECGDSGGLQRVPYSVVCDHRQQCADGSDESFCVFPPCSGSTPLRCGLSSQCVAISVSCNSQGDCGDNSDETHCVFYMAKAFTTHPPPAVVHFTPLSSQDRNSLYPDIQPLPPSSHPASAGPTPCPGTHFQCPGKGYCLPVFVRCNDVNDCPGREDEAGCDSESDVSCPGFYRCRSSRVCLHPSHVCDGVYQCPQHDDELFCRLDCPTGCKCHGLNFVCRQHFPAELYPEVRYLDASGSSLTPARLKLNTFLIHLCLSGCGLKTLLITTFPNLQSLDVGHNKLHAIRADHLRGMLNLKYISLSRNPLETLFSSDAENRSFIALRTLDVSGVTIHRLKAHTFSLFPNLRTLNLSQCDVRHVDSEGFHATSKLHVLDIVGCPMTQFPRDLLSGLDHLQAVQADNFKLCCPVILPPGFNLDNCRAPFDEVSSCDSLLRSDVYRIFLSIFSSLASLGNLGCFLLRNFVLKSSASGFGVFVHHLAISDFLMGVYMAIIGVADRLYMGSYLWEDISWRHSTACRTAGFLSLMSNEVSAVVICLITLDRFLVLRFPFNSSLHFKARSAHVTCTFVWVVVLVMAVFPLTPMTSHWSFYSQTGICIPLPITRGDFAGHQYAFGVLIVLNFILFLLITAGQAAIYVSIRANSLSMADSTKKSNDLRIARRLISVAVSDFLCWFPIGLLGLLASRGVPIPGEANVGIAILVLPLNSALNPFLYTINILLERRAKVRDEQLLKQLMAHAEQWQK